MKKIVHELHRRTLWQVLGIYLAGSWLVLQIVDILSDNMGLPQWVFPFALVLLLLGLPVVLATAFVQEGMPGQGAAPRASRGEAPGPGEFAPSARRSTDRGEPAGPARTPDTATPESSRRLFTWRNALTGGGLAFLLLAVVTGGFMFMRSQGIGPAGTLVARGVIDERSPILVAQFESSEADAELARSMTEAFRIDFSQTRIVRMVEPPRIAEALRRMQLDPSTSLTSEVARRLVRRDGIPALVTGSIARVPGGFVLTGRIESSADGSTLASHRETAADSSGVIPAIDALSGKLRERLGESFKSLRADAPLQRVTTASLPALELYSQAIRAIEFEGDTEGGVRLLREALDADPEFASAWRKLGIELGNLRGGSAETEHAVTRAYELRDRLTQRERYLAEAAHANFVLGDRQRAIAAYERMLDIDPADGWALNNVALLYGEEGDAEKALAYMERSVAVDTSPTSLANVVFHRLGVGDVDGADSVLSIYESKFPAEFRGPFARATVSVHREDFAGAEKAAREALAGRSEVAELAALTALNSVLQATGRLDEALATVERGARTADALDFPGTQFWVLFGRFWTDYLVRQDTAAARRVLRELSDESLMDGLDPLDRPYHGLAVAHAVMGDRVEAERLQALDRAAAPGAGDLRFRDDEAEVRGDLAWAKGRWDEAIEAYHEVRRLRGAGCDCELYALGLAHEGAGRADSAIAYFEQEIDVLGEQRLLGRSSTLGSALERIARLHDSQGRLDEAAAYYSRFADLWADADEDLQPRVAAARARAEEIVRARG